VIIPTLITLVVFIISSDVHIDGQHAGIGRFGLYAAAALVSLLVWIAYFFVRAL